MKKEIPKEIVMTGILALAALEITAIITGLDGKFLGLVMGIIGTTIGVTIPTPKFK